LQHTIHQEWQTSSQGSQQATTDSKELLTKLLEVGRHNERKIITGSNNTSVKEKASRSKQRTTHMRHWVCAQETAMCYPDRQPTPTPGAYLPHLTLELCFHGQGSVLSPPVQ
jgi:hypothetical protein